MIKYIGSKRTLVPRIVALAEALRSRTGATTACDLFTGTTRVAQGLKKTGFFVTANDAASYAEILAIAYIEADERIGGRDEVERKLAHLNGLPGCDGYFTQTFCVDSRYFQPGNGRRIDAIRGEIGMRQIPFLQQTVLNEQIGADQVRVAGKCRGALIR